MKRILTLLCCLSLCSIPGLAQKKSSKSAMSDQQFVDFAGQTDMVDANLGQLAGAAASSEPIKGYAQKVVTEQTDDFHQLSKAAHQASLNVPSAIDEEHNRIMIDPFQKLKGTTFDSRFVKEMVDKDNKAIAVYKNETAHAQNLALSSYAAEALPTLQRQLAAAKKLEKTKAATKKG